MAYDMIDLLLATLTLAAHTQGKRITPVRCRNGMQDATVGNLAIYPFFFFFLIEEIPIYPTDMDLVRLCGYKSRVTCEDYIVVYDVAMHVWLRLTFCLNWKPTI